MTDRWTVLIVEATPSGAIAAFEAAKANVLRAQSAGQAISVCLEHKVDLVVTDKDLPGETGFAVLQHLAGQVSSHTQAIVRSDDAAGRIEALELGAHDAVPMSVSDAELISRARRAQNAARTRIALEQDVSRLRELSVTDGLTQLFNHHAFQERLREEFRRSQRYDDPVALILLDLDHFKQINDQFGHQVGDAVLRGLSEVLKQAVRETDFLARYGGEEFAVLLPHTHLAGALTVAERISHDIHRMQLSSLKHLRVTASFGISCFPTRSISSPEQLLKTADDAMYRAKNEGRNKISLHQANLLAV